MFDYLKGKVFKKYGNALSLLCGCVGFKVFVPVSLLSEVNEGDELELFTELVVPPEGTPTLYGFRSEEERKLFRELVKVPKVGSKVALSVLSHLEPEELKRTVFEGDVESLSRVPGLGKKLSERIVAELRPKFEEEKVREIPAELYEILTSLGYKKSEINSALKGINLEGLTVNEAVKLALKLLSGRKF